MTFPLNNTIELFAYISNLSGVTFEESIEGNSNIKTIEFNLDYKPWIYATSINSMENDQILFEISGKSAKEQFPINILFTKEQVFFNDFNDLILEGIPIYSIEGFLERLFYDYENLQPLEYRAFKDLKSSNYTLTNLLAETIRLKAENFQFKNDNQNLISKLSDTNGKLEYSKKSIDDGKDDIKKLKRMIYEMANYIIQKDKLLSEKQVLRIVNFYNENATKFYNPSEFTISFYKSNKIIKGTYNEYYTAYIEGAGIEQRSHMDSYVYFDKNGEQLDSIEAVNEKLFDIEWDVFVPIYKNKISLT